MKVLLYSTILCCYSLLIQAQSYTSAVDEHGYYLGVTDLKNLENNHFYKKDIALCNRWFEENNLEKALVVKNYKIKNNQLYIFIEAADPFVKDVDFYGFWTAIANAYLENYQKPIAKPLFEHFSFMMQTPPERMVIQIARTKDGPILYELNYYDGDVETRDKFPSSMGKGIIDIPVVQLNIKDLPQKDAFEGSDLRKITSRIHQALKERFKNRKSSYLYFFTTSPISDSEADDAEMYFHVRNIKKEVLKESNYWEYLKIKIELTQIEKDEKKWIQVSYNLDGRYGASIVSSPSDWQDYYSMGDKYKTEMENYEKYQLKRLIKKAITNKP